MLADRPNLHPPSIILIITIGEADDQERMQCFNSKRMLAKELLMISFFL